MGNCIRHGGNVTVLSTAVHVSRGSSGRGSTYQSYDEVSPSTPKGSIKVEFEATSTTLSRSDKSRQTRFFGKGKRLKIGRFLRSQKGVSDLHDDLTKNLPEIMVTTPGGALRHPESVADENQNVTHFVSYTQIDIPEVSLGSYLLRQFDLHGDKVAVIDSQNDESYRYRDMAEMTRRIASGLWKRGFRQDHNLAIVVPRNSVEIAPVLCATLCSGGTCAVLDPYVNIEVLSRRLREVRPMVIVTESSLADTLLRATSTAGIMAEIYTIGHSDGFHQLRELHDDNGSCFPTAIKLQPKRTCALILFTPDHETSSKGVMLSHHNILANILQVQSTLAIKRGSTLGCFLSLTDHFGLIATFLCGFASGAKVILVQKPTLEHCITALIKYKPKRIHMESSMAKVMFEDDMMTLCNLSELESILCGTEPLSVEAQESIAQKVGDAKIFQAYGSTATLVTHCCCPLMTCPNGSSGNVVPNSICKVVDQSSGMPLYIDAMGEIWVNGPQCMMGYLSDRQIGGRPVDEWICTGNVGCVDSKGNLFIEASKSVA